MTTRPGLPFTGRLPRLALALTFALLPGIATAQATVLRIDTGRGRPVELADRDLRALVQDTVSMAHAGKPPVRYRAVLLTDVLARAGRPVDSLRAGKIGWGVLATARDGYVAFFSAAELDPKLGPTRVWLAFEADGKALPADDGPWRLVVPTDQKMARSARQVVSIRVVAIPGS